MKIHIQDKYPDGTDTFFIPKIKACFDPSYSKLPIKRKKCEIITGNVNSSVLQIWNNHYNYVFTCNLKKSSSIWIEWNLLDMRIIIDGKLLKGGEMMDFSDSLGNLDYESFVDWCYWVTNNGSNIFKGTLIYWM